MGGYVRRPSRLARSTQPSHAFLLFKKCLQNCVSDLVPLQGLALNVLDPVIDCTDGDKIVSLD